MLTEFVAFPDPCRVVRKRRFITGGDVTACIDAVLPLVAEMRGVETAQTVQLQLGYAPPPHLKAGRPEISPSALLRAAQVRMREAILDACRRTREVIGALGLSHTTQEL